MEKSNKDMWNLHFEDGKYISNKKKVNYLEGFDILVKISLTNRIL